MTKKIFAATALILLLAVTDAPNAFGEAPTGLAAPAGAQLPLRRGVGMSFYVQDQDYVLDSLEVGIPFFDPSVAKGLKVTNRTTTVHATLDYWLLPFLDLMILAGYIDGKTDVDLSQLNIGIPLQNITVKYKGEVYGAGFTAAGGWDKFFATLTVQYTNTNLDVSNSKVSAWVITPKFGYTVGKVGLFVGAEWQDPSEKHSGEYNVPPLGVVPYSVTLAGQDKWNYHAGMSTGIGRRWIFTLEGGFGNRTSGLFHVDYRW